MTTNQTPAKRGVDAGGAPNVKKKPLKPKKPMPKFMVAVWTMLVFLLLLGGAGYCLWANVGGIAEQALVLLPQYKASLATLDQRQKDLDAAEAKLAEENAKAATEAKANERKAAELTQREEKLQADQKAFDDKEAGAKTAEERQREMVQVYTKLNAATAASMLLKAPTLQEAAGVLSMLTADKAAEILTEINKTDAAKAYSLAKLMGQ